MARIIVVEDDLDQQEELVLFLSHVGHEVRGVSSASQLVACLEQFTPEVLLLDYNLASPDETGAQLARDLRLRYGTAVGMVMVTARGASGDRVECRRAGADDYLVKPIDFAELVAVIDNLRARLVSPSEGQPWRLSLGRLELLIPEFPVINLTGWEAMVLEVMAQSSNQLASRAQLIDAIGKQIWNYDDRALEAGISRLRRKFPKPEDGRSVLKAVRGMGYKFTHPLFITH